MLSWNEMTQTQKIIAVVIVFLALVGVGIGIYFAFIKKDTPKTETFTQSPDEIDKAGRAAKAAAEQKYLSAFDSYAFFEIKKELHESRSKTRGKGEGEGEGDFNGSLYDVALVSVRAKKAALSYLEAQTKLSYYTKYFDPKKAEEATQMYNKAKTASDLMNATWLKSTNDFEQNIVDIDQKNRFTETFNKRKEKLGIII